MAKIGLLVPSQRPQNIKRLLGTLRDTCQGDTSLVVGVDYDDPRLPEYSFGPEFLTETFRGYRFDRHENLKRVVPWMNRLAQDYWQQFDIVGHVGDDNTFDTPGWDLEVARALEDTPFAFGNDLYPRPPGSLCCHIFMRADIIGRLGYMGPPVLKHMYVDPVWMAWGKATGITYLHHVQIEHHHYSNQKASFDISYANSTGVMGEDFVAYGQYCRRSADGQSQLNKDILKIDPSGRQYTDEELAIFQQGLSIQW